MTFPGTPWRTLPSMLAGPHNPKARKTFVFLMGLPRNQLFVAIIVAIRKQVAVVLYSQEFIVIKHQTGRKPGFLAASVTASVTQNSLRTFHNFQGAHGKI